MIQVLLLIYISVGDVPTFLSRCCCVIYHSLENDVTLIPSGYMSTWSCYREEILVSSIRPIITDRSNGWMQTNIIRSLFRTCRPSSALWHLINQLANIQNDNMAYPQYPSFLNSTKFPKAFVSIDSLALGSCHLISRATPTCLLKFIKSAILFTRSR